MSVINSVLRDLDNRTTGFSPLPASAASENKVVAQTSQRSHWMLWLLLLVTIVALVLFAYPSIRGWLPQPVAIGPQQADQLPLITAQETPIQQPDPEPAPVISKQSELPSINGLQINEQSEYLQLTLLLSRHTASYLKHTSPNRYVFFINDGLSQIQAPEIQHNPWLSKVSFEQHENGLQVMFDTLEGIQVETHHQMLENEYRWVVRFRKAVPVVDIADGGMADREVSPANQGQVQQNPAQQANVESIQDASTTSETDSKPLSEPVRVEIKPVSQPTSDRQILALALQMIKNGQIDGAIARLQTLKSSALDQQVRMNLIQLYQQRGNDGEMERELEQALKAYPGDINLALIDAQRLYQQNQFMVLLNRYRDLDANMSLNSLLAASHQRLEQHELAVQRYQLALQQDPRQAKNWISLGISMEHLRDFESALQAYQNALQSGSLNQRLMRFTEQRILQLSGG